MNIKYFATTHIDVIVSPMSTPTKADYIVLKKGILFSRNSISKAKPYGNQVSVWTCFYIVTSKQIIEYYLAIQKGNTLREAIVMTT